MAALIDVRTGPEDHEDKQRRLLLLQAQRAKLLAQQQQQHSKSTSFLIRLAPKNSLTSFLSMLPETHLILRGVLSPIPCFQVCGGFSDWFSGVLADGVQGHELQAEKVRVRETPTPARI